MHTHAYPRTPTLPFTHTHTDSPTHTLALIQCLLENVFLSIGLTSMEDPKSFFRSGDHLTNFGKLVKIIQVLQTSDFRDKD